MSGKSTIDVLVFFNQVRHTSLEMNLQATLPEDRQSGESAQDDCLMDVDHLENSTDSDLDNPPAEDGGLISTCHINTLSQYERFLQNFFFFQNRQLKTCLMYSNVSSVGREASLVPSSGPNASAP